MTFNFAVIIPLLNPNEPEARLASIHIIENQQVSKGDLLCVLETTKSSIELESELDGYVVGFSYEPGQIVRAGDILCHVAPSPDWQPPVEAPEPKEREDPLPEGLRISRPALDLVKVHGIDLRNFTDGSLITTKIVNDLIEQKKASMVETDLTTIIIYGGGGHCKAIIDLLRAAGNYTIAGIIDDGIPAGKTIMGIKVLGGEKNLQSLRKKGLALAVNAVGGIGNLSSRVKVFQILSENGFSCPVLVHPRAFIESGASISAGVQVFPFAYIGSEASVGFGGIINTGAIVSHDCVLGEYVNISPGAILAGEVQVGARVLIGMGATINLQVRLGSGARIGNNATVKTDVPKNGIVRAGSIWPDKLSL